MTFIKSGRFPNFLAVAGFEPVGGRQGDCVFGQHAGQAGEDVGEVFLGVDAEAAAVFYKGVEDGAFLTGFFIAEEQPVFRTELGGANGVFDEVVANFYPAIVQVGFEVGPLVDGITDGFAEFALGQEGAAEGEFVDDALDPLVDHAAFGGADGGSQGGASFGFTKAFLDVIEVGELTQDPGDEAWGLLTGFEKFPPHMGVAAHEFDPGFVLGPGGINDVAVALDDAQEFGVNGCNVLFGGVGFFEESGHTFGVAAIMPVKEDGSAGYVRRPEVAGLCFAGAGLEIGNWGFVDLSVKGVPMFVLDFSIDDRQPVGGEQGPVAEGFAVNGHSHPSEHFGLPVVRQVADEAVIDDFGDEAGSGDAAVLQRWRQRIDEGLGGGVVLEDELAAHELEADELGGLEVELLADFFADPAEFVGIEQDFGRTRVLRGRWEGARECGVRGSFWGLLCEWGFQPPVLGLRERRRKLFSQDRLQA